MPINKISTKKILITGGAGFIGSALIRYIIHSTDFLVLNLDILTYAGNLDSLNEVQHSERYSFEAVDICESNTDLDLIFMDINMPVMDGYEATRKIRQLFEDKGIAKNYQPKIVAITGHVENEYIAKARQCGMDKVYPKPLPIKEFGQLLMQMKFIDSVP